MIGDMDLSISLQAGSLHVARVGETEVASGPVALKIDQERARTSRSSA